MRINKYLVLCELGSRRAVEELVLSGAVKINNKVVVNLATDVDMDNDSVAVNGIKVTPVAAFTYLMFNKPKGCICTKSDEKGRKTVFDYINIDKQLFTIGRLDYDTEGLLIVTNDGALSQRLAHPSNEIPKTYLVKIDGEIAENDLALLRKGVVLDGVKTHRAGIKLKEFKEGLTTLSITIYEGRNREIRRMFESIEKKVVFLKRIAVGDLKLGGLGRGAYRYLTESEIDYLRNI